MRFADRSDAGKKLASALVRFGDADTVIYALPRGGVPVGFEVAQVLGAPLDFIITRKIGHPRNPEYAVCAITEEGEMLCDEQERATINPEWLAREAERQKEEACRRRKIYFGERAHISAKGKRAILIDDGAATGLTLRAAMQSVRKENPKKLIVAIPVAPHDVVEILCREADEVIVLENTEHFRGAVGAYYENFSQVSDEEVIDLLHRTQ